MLRIVCSHGGSLAGAVAASIVPDPAAVSAPRSAGCASTNQLGHGDSTTRMSPLYTLPLRRPSMPPFATLHVNGACGFDKKSRTCDRDIAECTTSVVAVASRGRGV